MNHDKFQLNPNLKPEFEVQHASCSSLDWSHEINRYPPTDSSTAAAAPLESSHIFPAPTLAPHSNYPSDGYYPQHSPQGYSVRIGQRTRYHGADSNTAASVPLEPSHIFSAPALPAHSNYPSDGYIPQNNPQGYSVRLGQGLSSAGIPHQRHAPLPVPIQHTRELYAANPPTFRRTAQHTPRSPTAYPARRHHPLSPSTISPRGFPGATIKMDAPTFNNVAKSTPNIPPLGEMISFGTLQYSDGHNTPVNPIIYGSIDKGFFLSDKEWTCYRRNYFSCVCSFSLDPYYPTVPITFKASNSQAAYTVSGFAMTISAVVSEVDNHKIDLVQHTPKRDKGPTSIPAKVRLSPKVISSMGNSQGSMGMFGPSDPGAVGMATRSGMYDGGYVQPQQAGGPPLEYSFERIQFKQATANNGKRRAAQQYYHLVVELWADVGSASDHPHWVQVAQRKSAKMIVRGRSPGHYQAERRASTNGGSGGVPNAMAGYNPGIMRAYPILG